LSTEARRKVCVVLVDRANYGRLKPVMGAIVADPRLELQVLCTGTMVLERFDHPARMVQADGFQVNAEAYVELEGSTPVTMAKSVGVALLEIASELKQLAPDLLFVIGDRYEALAAAIAAAYMNVPIAHMQGGEVSGSIDESARHAITKFAQFHFPSTKRSADYLIRMGERPDSILAVGCPSSDIARTLDRTLEPSVVNSRGGGPPIDVKRPFLLVVFHPTTTEHGDERPQMFQLLTALERLDTQALLLWPNIDAGSDQLSKAIRIHRDRAAGSRLRTLTNLGPEDYLRVLGAAACAVGNSSSFVRDASYLGTPVVLVGNRQEGRETAEHVTRVKVETDAIVAAVRAQLAHGPYPPSSLYGDGHVSGRVATALAELVPYVQKQLAYVRE
jgi:UDP-hydrolysing UDP-N-acetyl-D-glucosamine 2-epimerase